jgi:hypothetical protein
MAGAAVMLQSQTSRWSCDLKTDLTGAFSFVAVPLGSYKLSVRAAGLAS